MIKLNELVTFWSGSEEDDPQLRTEIMVKRVLSEIFDLNEISTDIWSAMYNWAKAEPGPIAEKWGIIANKRIMNLINP